MKEKRKGKGKGERAERGRWGEGCWKREGGEQRWARGQRRCGEGKEREGRYEGEGGGEEQDDY